jgi:hypothetical protein
LDLVDLVSLTLTQVQHFIDTSIGSVFEGRDIRMGAEVALKIGSTDQSPGLNHKYNVYTNIAGSVGTSSVLWYGKEDLYEVIVLDSLQKSSYITGK